MSEPYVGEIRMFGGNFAPQGWAFCGGQQLPIAEYDVLFNLIGTTYGGDGQTTFNLPDLRGRVPIHQGTARSGTNYPLGLTGGAELVTLSSQTIPAHTHPLSASTVIAQQSTPTNNVLANSQGLPPYIQEDPDNSLGPQAMSSAGGSQPHENRQPFLGINFIISLFGIFPSQN